jgi:ribonuclease HII
MKKIIAGVDEVGRGSLIGPVYAAAVILKKKINTKLLKDSKLISKQDREKLNIYIKKNSYWSISKASVKEIEKLNILNASLLAMKRAIKKLHKKPNLVIIDGNKIPEIKNYNLKSIVKADQKIPSVSAASIIAKVSRDKFITKLSKKFKNYGWETNYGYGTKKHLSALKKFGATHHHRKTFAPLHKM